MVDVVDEFRRYIKPKQCRYRDIVYCMTEKKQLPKSINML